MPRPKKFFDSKLIARLSRMELTARRIVDGFLAGKNRSSRHGYSVEFVEHREYVPGDDLRHLDWKVLAKLNRYYIKRYEEETNITAVLLLDASASMSYGPDRISKFEAAATAASALAYLLNRQRDAVGLVVHDRTLRSFFRPSVKLTSVASMLSRLEETEPRGETGFEAVVKEVTGQLSRRCVVIVLSDLFIDQEELDAGLKFLHYRGHDALVLQFLDSAERTFPFTNNILFRGLEDRRELLTEPQRLRTRYLELLDEFLARVRKACQSCAFDYKLVDTGDPLGPTLSAALAARHRRRDFVRVRRGRV